MLNLRTFTLLFLLAGTLTATACTGTFVTYKSQNRTFTAEAACINFLGMQFPGDPQIMAEQKVPPGSTILSVQATPLPAASFLLLPGIINKYLIGYNHYAIAGTVK